ncbi:MAG: hypothetical protein KME23_08060 [Goleter apudmare HA4340-LM2]|jgi:hypothetical protein|nr:hypothetical protein [Goleter apudmare HA4340-LM2]
MTKPLGYYTGYTPGDEGLLAELQEAYGEQLQGLNRSEKLCLITLISADLLILASIETPYCSEVFLWMIRIKEELAIADREGLLSALIDGVRYQK